MQTNIKSTPKNFHQEILTHSPTSLYTSIDSIIRQLSSSLTYVDFKNSIHSINKLILTTFFPHFQFSLHGKNSNYTSINLKCPFTHQ